MAAPPVQSAPTRTAPVPVAVLVPQRRRARRWTLVRPVWADVALIAVFAGAWIRLQRWKIGAPLWLDEQMISLNIRDHDFFGLAGELDRNQSAPLGWLWLQWLAARIAGTDERVLRLAPLLFSIGTIVLAWWIGRRWLGPVGTMVLTLLCAFTPQFIRYADEVKQYSADTFWVLALVGLAAWVLDDPQRTRRSYVWWAVAALALWFSMAAVMVAPGLVMVMAGVWWRRHGLRPALTIALPGFAWLASFGAHYLLALRYAVGSDFLTAYWSAGFAPQPFALDTTADWLAERPELLAADPIGTPESGLFWTLVVVGLVVAFWRRPWAGLLLLAPVAFAVTLAVLHMVPLLARLALWVVPLLFVLVAIALDAPARALVAALRRPRAGLWWVAVTALACSVVMAFDAAVLLVEPLTVAAQERRRPPNGGDDRAGVRWVAEHRRDGDLVLVLRHSHTAFLWYDRTPYSPGTYRLTDTARPGDDCSQRYLGEAVSGHRRVILYSGIRLSPYPRTHEVIAAQLARRGRLVDHAQWGVVQTRIFEIDPTGPLRPPAPVLAAVELSCVKVLAPGA